MNALFLTAALFVYVLAVGAGVLRLLGRRTRLSRRLPLAPALGVTVCLLTTYWLNQMGWPVRTFAAPLAVTLLAPGLGAVLLQRPPLPWRAHTRFAVVVAGVLLMMSGPMRLYGFNWLSFGNDDMTNYVLAAHRFADHGFNDIPDMTAMTANTDPTLGYWFMHVIDGSRCGAELLLAMVVSLTGRSGHEVFMPVIVCLHLVLVCAAGALLANRPRRLSRGLLASVLVAGSALCAFGTLYQLIAQVLGLGLLCAASTVYTRRRLSLADAGVGVMITAALLIGYPEVLPFLGLEMLLMTAWIAWRRRPGLRQAVWGRCAMGGLSALLVAPSTLGLVDYLTWQITMGSDGNRTSNLLFPFYLVPSGLANACGIAAVARPLSDPYLSVAIVAGAATMLITAVAIVRGAARGLSHALIGLVMLGLAAWLFKGRSGFGLYKIAMFIQPFAAAALAAAAVASRRPRVWGGALGLLIASNLVVTDAYVRKSLGDVAAGGGGFVEVPYASKRALLQRLTQASSTIDAPFVGSDTPNIVFQKIESLYFPGRTFLDATFGPNLTYFADNSMSRIVPRAMFARSTVRLEAAETLRRAMNRHLEGLTFDLHALPGEVGRNRFPRFLTSASAEARARGVMLVEGRAQGLLNRDRKPKDEHGCMMAVPMASLENHLQFVPSYLGQENYFGRRDSVSLYQMEPDPLRGGEMFAGLGRHLLFSVLHPTPRVRLCLEITRTLAHDGENTLPPVAVVGTSRVPLRMVGRGSARVISEPLEPQQIAGTAYLALDLGMEGRAFPYERTGLMRLYGTDLALDSRLLVAFGRNISLISEIEYLRRAVPSSVALPGGLADTSLEYSGVYEDGWTSERAVFRLAPGIGQQRLQIKGMVPLIGNAKHQAVLTVRLDGRIVLTRTVGLGEFDVVAQVGDVQGPVRVDVTFDRLQTLPDGDGRPAAALLREVGFTR